MTRVYKLKERITDAGSDYTPIHFNHPLDFSYQKPRSCIDPKPSGHLTKQ